MRALPTIKMKRHPRATVVGCGMRGTQEELRLVVDALSPPDAPVPTGRWRGLAPPRHARWHGGFEKSASSKGFLRW